MLARFTSHYDKSAVYEMGISLSEMFLIIAFGLYGPFVPVNDAELCVPPVIMSSIQNPPTKRGFVVRLMILKVAASLVFPEELFKNFEAEVLKLPESHPVLIAYVNLFVAQMNTRLGSIQTAINNWLHKNLFSPAGPVAPWRGESC